MKNLEEYNAFYYPDGIPEGIPEPKTFKEWAIAKLCGLDVDIPADLTPKTPIEKYLAAYDGSSGGGVLVIGMTLDFETGAATLDKTWHEIHDANFAVIKMIFDLDAYTEYAFVYGIEVVDEYHYVYAATPNAEGATDLAFTSVIFQTDSADGYPVADLSGGGGDNTGGGGDIPPIEDMPTNT